MKVFVWRHNRRFHSWSMLDEPCVHQDFYTDAVIIVQAESEEDAYKLVSERERGWIGEEMKRLRPTVFEGAVPGIIFADVRGD